MSFIISDLDYDNILNNFKNYLKSQEKFKDYNFDGAAITELLRLLSYNTFYNSFYINNIANEMYLDSATERSSIVSRAKALGYTPSSRLCSQALIDLTAYVSKVEGEVIPISNSFITLNRYSQFLSSVQETDYTFLTTEAHNLLYVGEGSDYWQYKKNNITIKEGQSLNYAFKVEREYDKYTIPNPGIDLSTLIVKVFPTMDSVTYESFEKTGSFVDIDEESPVYWIYEGDDEKFYLEFGNGIYGKKLDIGNVIYIEYLICNGEAANGCKNFSVGSYGYSNTSILETQGLVVNNSIYTYVNIYSETSDFEANSIVIGSTSNTQGVITSYSDNTLLLNHVTNNFIVNEQVYEYSTLTGNTGATAYIASIRTTESYSSGGSDIESTNSIKFNAPKYFASQNRLVTKTDYETIIKHEYPYVDSVVCWGGEENDPEELGEVFISVKPRSRETLTESEKTYILENIIEDRKMIGINANIVDADYIYIYPTINVNYQADLSADTTQESIESIVTENIYDYCKIHCGYFNNSFYFSKFVAMIDDSNEFIISNSTDIQIIKHFKPTLAVPYTANNYAKIEFNNSFTNTVSDFYSSEFTCNVGGTLYSNCSFSINSSNTQILSVSNSSGGYQIVNAGTIDSSNGIIYISNATISTTSLTDTSNTEIIKITVNPVNMDLQAEKKQILKIYDSILLTSTPIRIK
jgi:hypothetical protein